jgi:site-specific DNA recombinase
MRTAAIYARVSTPRQGREQTIESQLAVLKSWADENSYELSPENVYTDEGYSGSGSTAPGWTPCVMALRMGLSRSSEF